MTDETPRTPTTAAGRRLQQKFADGSVGPSETRYVHAILAIEAEARAEVTDDMTTAYMVGYEAGKAEARASLEPPRADAGEGVKG